MTNASDDRRDARAAAVADRLAEVLGGPVAGLRRLSGGASRETWALDFEARDADARGLIAQLDRVAHAEVPGLGRRPPQADLLRAAAAAGVPVPGVLAAGEDDDVLGPAWTVVERLEGTADPEAILAGEGVPGAAELLDQIAAAAAAVHRIEIAEGLVGSIDDPLGFLRKMSDALDQPHPTFELAFGELEATRPERTRRAFVHGDLRLGNLLVGPMGLAAVLDWELAHVGDPMADLGWLCIRAWRFGRPDRPAAGLGTREELTAAYERHAGVPVDREALRWWELYGDLRWGLICVAQAFTHLSGAATSLEHAVIGRRACEVEWDLLDLLAPSSQAEALVSPSTTEDLSLDLHDRPTAPELVDAVRGSLGEHVLPLLEGRPEFELRVALRALGMVRREVANAPAHERLAAGVLEELAVADQRELATAVRAGDFDERRDELIGALRALVRAKLEAANPRHLEPIPTTEER